MTNFTPEQSEKATNIEAQLGNFDIGVSVQNVSCGPVITRYELSLNPGVRVSKITGLEHDLAMALRASSVRFQIPVPGTSFIGIEVPNETREMVNMGDLISNLADSDGDLDFILGKDTVGKPIIMDITKFPHLLVAGQTGSGKSVMINTLISSIIMNKTPEEVKFIMLDPKIVELVQYKSIPHLQRPIITEPNDAIDALEWAVDEMERRYSLLADASVRNIKRYNDISSDKLHYIVFVIDEMADLMLTAGRKAEEYIQRITQKARAVGIHMVLATQRPSVNVVTGTIKANVPARIACKVASQVDSKTILDHKGAEQLLGKGDMLIKSEGYDTIRAHGAFLDDDDIDEIVNVAIENHEIPTSPEKPVKVTSLSHDLYLNALLLLDKYNRISKRMVVEHLKVNEKVAGTIIQRLMNDKMIHEGDSETKIAVNR